jgi:NitT/TauT family transport system substrate-binding protein
MSVSNSRHSIFLPKPTAAILLVAALALATLSSPACGARTPDVRTIRLAVARSPFTYLPVYLAEPLGYYKAEGLNVEIAEFAGGSQSILSVMGGSADIAAGFYEHAIEATAAGKRLQAFVTMLKYPGMALVISPKASRAVTRIEDLKGLRVGVGTPGSPTHFYLNYLLSQHGMRGDDVGVVGIGAPQTAALAVEAGKVDAAVVGAAMIVLQRRVPQLQVLAETFSRDGVRESLGVDEYPGAALLARVEWLRDNADTSRRLARAIVRSLQYIESHQPAEILERLPAAYRTDPDTDLACMKAFAPLFSADGRIDASTADGVKRVLSVSLENVRVANIDLAQTYTNSFLPAK